MSVDLIRKVLVTYRNETNSPCHPSIRKKQFFKWKESDVFSFYHPDDNSILIFLSLHCKDFDDVIMLGKACQGYTINTEMLRYSIRLSLKNRFPKLYLLTILHRRYQLLVLFSLCHLQVQIKKPLPKNTGEPEPQTRDYNSTDLSVYSRCWKSSLCITINILKCVFLKFPQSYLLQLCCNSKP